MNMASCGNTIYQLALLFCWEYSAYCTFIAVELFITTFLVIKMSLDGCSCNKCFAATSTAIARLGMDISGHLHASLLLGI
jgi:hypothetical protein